METDPMRLIEKYYPEDNALRRLLVHHSRQVAAKALDVADRHPELGLDRAFLYRAAMLHDIGIFRTDAPAIHCHGTAPYLMHGRLGAELMRAEGLEREARVCERHTGTGLTAAQIEAQGLPLPPADRGRSRSNFIRPLSPGMQTTGNEAARIASYNNEGVSKFRHTLFSYPSSKGCIA